MAKNKPTVISLFAGCGGSSLGYKMAGYRELLAIDFEENAIATFRKNFRCKALQADIRETTGRDIMKLCGIKKGGLDVLDGSPPCQGFSRSNVKNKRRIRDPRNNLVLRFIELVEEIQPKVFIMENVMGMAQGKAKGLFIGYMKKMKEMNYRVKCKLMNAMYYGVPQSRRRAIFMGVRNDLKKEPIYPKLSNRFIAVADALRNIKNSKEELAWAKKITSSDLCKKYMALVKQGESASKYHPRKLWFNFQRIDGDKPSFCVLKLISKGGSNLIHPYEDRNITIAELKVLHSFPGDFVFTGGYTQQWARIGNSVPPLMMRAIAKTIRKEIL